MIDSANQRPSREFIAELRHHLRTPLNHIIGYSEMLLEDEGILPEQIAIKLRYIDSEARSLLSLLHNMLTASANGITLADIDVFRREMLPQVQNIARMIGPLIEIADEKIILDLLRIATATAELLDFGQKESSGLPPGKLKLDIVTQRPTELKASILIVDDDEINRDILSRQLQRLGFTVIATATGSEALISLRQSKFDVALVDLMMPVMDGLELLEIMKADEATRSIPVIMMSALDDLDGVSRCMERGAEDYLFKPFEPVLLSARISAALERSRLRAQERERTAELEHISQELRRSNEDLKQFAYAASHDLQTPLRTITTHLQLLERHMGDRLSPDDRELLSYPVEAAMRMNQLIKDLLVYSQVSVRESRVSPVSCEEVLNETLADLQGQIRETQATVTHAALPTVMADAVQLRQLFSNLISNAIKYRSEALPRISVNVREEFHQWHFTVSDNGLGISPEYKDDIFKLFRRLHGQERPGTGLGLAICKRIMERLGGNIWVESEPGAGSTFHFTIPDSKLVPLAVLAMSGERLPALNH
ncbi:MAG: response regulator [Acidobacteriaceae bacterium]|nr:response regulator [Acidobacteriaceae bacterium]